MPTIATAIAKTMGQIIKATVFASGNLAVRRLTITIVVVVAIYAMLMASAKVIAATMTTMPRYR